ncbi:MAG TPA: type IV pilin protein, partial [Armatimonadota bacterium]|nr:type IV pilin protein [Armatimonadota bacterium]
KKCRGFTLIEVMIVVAIIGILAAIVVPNYTAYVQRGRITEATSNLGQQKIVMERYYQDHRDYGSTLSVCGPTLPANGYFTYDCKWGSDSTNQTFLLTATGNSAKGMSGFVFTIDESNNKKTTNFQGDGVTRNCWISKKNETC